MYIFMFFVFWGRRSTFLFGIPSVQIIGPTSEILFSAARLFFLRPRPRSLTRTNLLTAKKTYLA